MSMILASLWLTCELKTNLIILGKTFNIGDKLYILIRDDGTYLYADSNNILGKFCIDGILNELNILNVQKKIYKKGE